MKDTQCGLNIQRDAERAREKIRLATERSKLNEYLTRINNARERTKKIKFDHERAISNICLKLEYLLGKINESMRNGIQLSEKANALLDWANNFVSSFKGFCGYVDNI